MRKTFALQLEGRHPDRVLDAVKHEIRKYQRRERRRALPEGMDFWDFDCRIGADSASAAAIHPAELIGALDDHLGCRGAPAPFAYRPRRYRPAGVGMRTAPCCGATSPGVACGVALGRFVHLERYGGYRLSVRV